MGPFEEGKREEEQMKIMKVKTNAVETRTIENGFGSKFSSGGIPLPWPPTHFPQKEEGANENNESTIEPDRSIHGGD